MRAKNEVKGGDQVLTQRTLVNGPPPVLFATVIVPMTCPFRLNTGDDIICFVFVLVTVSHVVSKSGLLYGCERKTA